MNSFTIFDTEFYYSKSGALQYMLEKKNSNEIALGLQSQRGRSFASMKFPVLENIIRQNHHLYEICSDQRRIIFDVEYYNDDEIERNQQWDFIKKWIIQFVEKFTKIEKIVYTDGSGLKNNSYRTSHHIIFHTEHYLNGMDAIKIFKEHLHIALIKETNRYILCPKENKFAIDTAVYGKNQQFKLPYQSKFGETRVHNITNIENITLNDMLVSPFNITDKLQLEMEKPQNIIEKIKNTVKKMKKQNDKISVTDDDNQLIHYMIEAYDNKQNSNWNGSYSVYDIVNLIPNNKKVEYKLYFAIMCGIKRATKEHINGKNDGLQLFLKWANLYNDGDEKKNWESKAAYENCNQSKHCYGFQTLLFVASYCCPALETKQYYIHRLMNQRLPDEIIEPTNRLNFNKYIIEHNLVFIKSGMSTGKSYGIHNLPKDSSCVFLSSRQAFANSQSFELKNDGFVNYMDEETNFYEKRIIVSLESIYKLNWQEYDYLIIDESESIFNIISSPTLIKGQFQLCLQKFEKLVINCKKVLVMDAFLSERSIEAILIIRNKKRRKEFQNYIEEKSIVYYLKNDFVEEKGYYIENPFPAPKRTANIISKEELVSQMINKLKNNERCVLVCGSRIFAEWAIQHIKRDTKDKTILFYNSNNKLPLGTDVDTEWSKADILIYTPSITCGISYSKGKPFDNLFIYAVNTHSAHFRDIIQASRRCRTITNTHIYICLNTKFKTNENLNPTHMDIINNHKENYIKSLKDTFDNANIKTLNSVNEWVGIVDSYNIMERNIHSVYLQEVAEYYFQKENIKILKTDSQIEEYELDNELKEDEFITGKNINLIDANTYNVYIQKMKKNTLPLKEMAEYRYYIFHYWLKQEFRLIKDKVDTLYDIWAINRNVLKNLKKIKQMTYYTTNTLPSDQIVEHIDKNILPLTHLHTNLKEIQAYSINGIDCEKAFSREDFENLKYKDMSVSDINRICNKTLFKSRDTGTDGKINNYNSKKGITIINTLLNQIGYKIKTNVRQAREKGVKIRIYTYQIAANKGDDILSKMCPHFQNYDIAIPE